MVSTTYPSGLSETLETSLRFTAVALLANRATAVNLREVSKVSESPEGYVVLTIGNHPPVECSRRQSVEFRRMREI